MNMKTLIKKSIKRLPYLKRLFNQRDQLLYERDKLLGERNCLQNARDQLIKERDGFRDQMQCQYSWPGHFHSPIPSIDEIKKREKRIFGVLPQSLPQIDLNEQEQLSLFDSLKQYYADLPFEAEKKAGFRYYFANQAFDAGDAITFFCMLRNFRPKRVIEAGSGYSSCVLLDTNEHFLDNSVSCTFIEPYPEILKQLLTDADKSSVRLIEKNLQDVDLELFEELEAGDFLFIDSSHVSKIDSDVNYIFFGILPALKPGVYIHFHDIFYPFEYPKGWIYEGRAWNEAYMLRAFLEYNKSFKIIFFNSYWAKFHRERIGNGMPLWLRNPGGSIWLKKIE
jgi:hypothetical protein